MCSQNDLEDTGHPWKVSIFEEAGTDDDKMPLRLATGKNARLFAKEPGGRRSRSSMETRVVLEGLDADKEEDYDSRFVPTSPVISPTTGVHPTWTGPISCVQRPLSSSSYTEFDLLHHLQRISETNKETVTALGDVFRQRDELTVTTLFSLEPEVQKVDEEASYCEVHDIQRDGAVIPRYDDCVDTHNEGLESSPTWDLIKEVNRNRNAVGRITILQQPSATSFAGIHMTMRHHFDMDELFARIISNKLDKGKTTPYMLRAFEPKPIRQRSFLFVFKYYTVVDEDLTSASWQQHDIRQSEEESADHIDISECSSIVALSLEGEAVDQVPRRASKSNRVTTGSVYDTFAPFHVLNIQCCPDLIRSDRDMAENPCYSGPQAFLECLAAEYRTAGQRLWRLNERIGGLVIPPDQFMFDLKIRDKLLFEDADFTFSRRYFWAYNSLARVNDSIRSMINAYSDTFTPEFWSGQHPTLWPHSDPESAEGCNYLAQLGRLRQELECSMKNLKAVIRSNELLRREVDNLREQLYSGSSVKENRTTIEQGENIKILTGISMLFMPLSFVTSLFGMTDFTIAPSNWRFIVIAVTICVPFFLLVLVLQTHAGMTVWRQLRLSARRGLEGWKKRASTRREKRSQLQQAAMIRRQSCAPNHPETARRDSQWALNAKKGSSGATLPPLRTGGKDGRDRRWPGWGRKRESVVARRDANV